MFSCFVSLWMAATVGQVPSEVSWLRSVPADVPVLVRVRPLKEARGDLLAMLKAMGPTVAGMAEPAIEQALQEFEKNYGEAAGKNPFFVLFRLPDPAQPEFPPWSVIVKTGDHGAAIKSLSQEGGEKPKAFDGYDSFSAKNGQTWYATKGAGWLAFGPDEEMIKAIRKPQSSLAEVLSPEIQAKLLAGNVGLYVNIAEVRTRYGDAIEQFKPMIMAQIEQAQNPGGPQNIKNAKTMLDGLTEALKVGDRLALGLDFNAAGFILSGLATVKGDSQAAKGLTRARTGTGALLAKLPSDLMIYVFAGDTSTSQSALPKAGAGAAPGSKTSPGLEQATAARMRALDGRLVMGMTLTPMHVVSLADPKDPNAAVKASMEANKARQALKEAEMIIEPNALTHGGFRLDRVRTKVDPEKLAKDAQPNVPNAQEIFKKVIGGKEITDYTGTDGKLFLETTAQSEDQVKARIDAITDGSHSLGSLAAWKALRAKFPEQVTVLVLLSAQESVKMILSSVGAMSNNADLKPPADLPKTPVLMGFALITSPKGYDFRLIIPSDVGLVFEKGLAPLGHGN